MAINPLISNNFVDSCAFDPKYSPEDAAAIEIFRMYEKENLLIQIAHSTKKEIEHPNTPGWVKQEAIALIYSLEVQLTPSEAQILHQIESILAGNGKVENIKQDARHVFEAQKYGSYFITTDSRILKRADAIQKICTVRILKPSEFLYLAKKYKVSSAMCKTQDISGERIMDKVVYKGYEIRPAPYQLRDSGEWSLNIYIAVERGYERVERNFSAGNTYSSKNEAIVHCVNYGREIIDGNVKNCKVTDL